VALERTFDEWQGTLFAKLPTGKSCASSCHMDGRNGTASTTTAIQRRLHSHTFPAVDTALIPFPDGDRQRMQVQEQLDLVAQTTVCVNDAAGNIEVSLDNVAAGHSWPSGATQDRRAWVEVTAYAGETVLLHSGAPVGGGAGAPTDADADADPNLWM